MVKKEKKRVVIAPIKSDNNRLIKYWPEGLIFLFTMLLYANSLWNGYNMDDTLVTQNHRLTSQGISAISEILTSPYYQDESGYSYEYRPIVLMSFAIEHSLFGESPFVSHLINLLLYSLCCVLLYIVLRKLWVHYTHWLVLGVCLLFSAHTAHTEVVCSIKNRDEILAMLFGLLAFYFAIKAFLHNNATWLVGTFFCMNLALLCKITIVPFVFIIPLASVLFLEISYKQLMFQCASLVLFVPFLLTNTGNIPVNFLIIPFSLLVFSVLYLQKNFGRIKDKVHAAFLQVEPLTTYDQVESDISSKNFYDNLLGLFRLSSYSFSRMEIYIFVINLVLLLFNFYFLDSRMTLLIVFANAILVLSKGKLAPVFTLNFISTVLSLILFNRGHSFAIFELFILFLSILLFSKPDKMSRLYMWVYILCVLFLSYYFKSFGFLLLFVFFYKQIGIGILILYFIMLLFSLKSFTSDFTTPDFVNKLESFVAFLIFPALLGLHFRKVESFVKPFLVSVIIIFSFVVVNYQPVSKHKENSTRTFSKLEFLNEPVLNKIISKKENRKLGFAERPITPDDIQSVRIGTSFSILLQYAKKAIFPYPLGFYYGYAFITPVDFSSTEVILSLIIYLLLLVLAFYTYFKNKLISFGLFIYLLSVLVFANYFSPIPGCIGDRYLLVPSLGVIIALMGVIFYLFKIALESGNLKWNTIPLFSKALFFIVLILYSSLTFSRNFDWRSPLDLMQKDIIYLDKSAQAHNLLAINLVLKHFEVESSVEKQKYLTEAKRHFERAIEIYPDFPNPHFDLGRVNTMLGRDKEAIPNYEYFIEKVDSTFPTAYELASSSYIEIKDTANAIRLLEKWHRIDSLNVVCIEKLSYIYFLKGDFENSLRWNLKGYKIKPDNLAFADNIVFCYSKLNRQDSALVFKRKHEN